VFTYEIYAQAGDIINPSFTYKNPSFTYKNPSFTYKNPLLTLKNPYFLRATERLKYLNTLKVLKTSKRKIKCCSVFCG